MKEWRQYMSESDGSWLMLKNKDAPELPNDSISLNGQEAIMLKKCQPSDHVSIQILPAARITDNVKNVVHYEKEFYIQLFCMKDDWSVISANSYSSDEALKIANQFIGLTKDRAIKVWEIKKMGSGEDKIYLD